MKNRLPLFGLATIGLLAMGLAFSANSSRVAPTGATPVLADRNDEKKPEFRRIHELNRQKPTQGRFETEGFVAKIYTAPPCPPGADCKPSMKDNIVISETDKRLEIYDLTEKK